MSFQEGETVLERYHQFLDNFHKRHQLHTWIRQQQSFKKLQFQTDFLSETIKLKPDAGCDTRTKLKHIQHLTRAVHVNTDALLLPKIKKTSQMKTITDDSIHAFCFNEKRTTFVNKKAKSTRFKDGNDVFSELEENNHYSQDEHSENQINRKKREHITPKEMTDLEYWLFYGDDIVCSGDMNTSHAVLGRVDKLLDSRVSYTLPLVLKRKRKKWPNSEFHYDDNSTKKCPPYNLSSEKLLPNSKHNRGKSNDIDNFIHKSSKERDQLKLFAGESISERKYRLHFIKFATRLGKEHHTKHRPSKKASKSNSGSSPNKRIHRHDKMAAGNGIRQVASPDFTIRNSDEQNLKFSRSNLKDQGDLVVSKRCKNDEKESDENDNDSVNYCKPQTPTLSSFGKNDHDDKYDNNDEQKYKLIKDEDAFQSVNKKTTYSIYIPHCDDEEGDESDDDYSVAKTTKRQTHDCKNSHKSNTQIDSHNNKLTEPCSPHPSNELGIEIGPILHQVGEQNDKTPLNTINGKSDCKTSTNGYTKLHSKTRTTNHTILVQWSEKMSKENPQEIDSVEINLQIKGLKDQISNDSRHFPKCDNQLTGSNHKRLKERINPGNPLTHCAPDKNPKGEDRIKNTMTSTTEINKDKISVSVSSARSTRRNNCEINSLNHKYVVPQTTSKITSGATKLSSTLHTSLQILEKIAAVNPQNVSDKCSTWLELQCPGKTTKSKSEKGLRHLHHSHKHSRY